MKQYHNSIEINAPIEKVWQSIIDFGAYPTWNPLVGNVIGDLKGGSILNTYIIPSEKALKKGKTYVYAEVENTEGHTAQVNIIGPEAYIFTAQTLTNITQKILSASWKPGFQTPAIYGKEILSSSFQNVTIK